MVRVLVEALLLKSEERMKESTREMMEEMIAASLLPAVISACNETRGVQIVLPSGGASDFLNESAQDKYTGKSNLITNTNEKGRLEERGVVQHIVHDLSGLSEALAWLFGNPFSYCNFRVGALPFLVVWVTLMVYALSTKVAVLDLHVSG